jgi:acyl carrier protein
MTQTERTIRAFLTDNFFVEDHEIDGDTSLIGTSVIDSTGVLEIIIFIEETFGISVPDSDAVPENLDTVDNMVSYVQGRVARLSA